MNIKNLPQHKDCYFFGYGIDINDRVSMANTIIQLKQENQQLKENNQAMQEEMARTWKKLEVIKKLVIRKIR